MDNQTKTHIKCPNCKSNILIELLDYHKYQCDKSFRQQNPQQSPQQNIGSVRRNRPIIQNPTMNQQHPQQPQFQQQQIIINNNNNQSQEGPSLEDQICRYCCEGYPAFLMEEHLDVCQARLDLRSGNHRSIYNSNQPVRLLSNQINEDEFDSLPPGQTRYIEIILPNGTVKIVNASRSNNGHLTTQTTITQSSNNMQINQPLRDRMLIILNDRMLNIGGLHHVQGHQKKSQGLRSEELQNINSIKFKASAELSEDNKKCVICIADYHPGDDLKVLPCLHRFHIECIENWLKSSPLCPICKKNIRNQQT